jgi:phenylacetate-CoA ligase
MSDALLNIYHRLPSPLRSVAASLRGYYLRSWRYGPETESLVEAALERESWSPERWKKWQEVRLAYVLSHAAQNVPFYREQWSRRRRAGDRSSWEYLENWPILEKDSLREMPKAFLADTINARKMFHEHTSGTTGTPLNLWWSRKTVWAFYALFEARWRRWYGISSRDRWAILGGQLITAVANRRPPFWVWNSAFNQLYMSSYHLAPDLIPYYLDALKKYRIKYIFGYSSALHALAESVLQLNRKDLQLTVAITNAEPLFDHQRERVSAAFQCPIRETYGMAEIVTAASECSEGVLHSWPEVGWVEIVNDFKPVNRGGAGDLVCTSLLNTDMPLVRYRVGDRGTHGSASEVCGCGRQLPTLGSIEGRIDDVLFTADGRLIGRLDPVFKEQFPVREAQIIQESIDRIRLRYVPRSEFGLEMARLMIERLRDRLGPVDVVLEQMDHIPRGTNGKFRTVVCNLSKQEKTRLRNSISSP